MYYRRIIISGATYFFTLNLVERKHTLLIDEIGRLKFAFKTVKRKHQFKLEAIVILPDHLHMLMRLPTNASDFSEIIKLIKSYFSRQIASMERTTLSRIKKRERSIW